MGAILGSIGSALEWYDFTLYVYPAPVLADLFFPSSDPLDGLLAAYGVLEAGFLMRRPPRPGPIEDCSTAGPGEARTVLDCCCRRPPGQDTCGRSPPAAA
jgi:hypothetical protein